MPASGKDDIPYWRAFGTSDAIALFSIYLFSRPIWELDFKQGMRHFLYMQRSRAIQLSGAALRSGFVLASVLVFAVPIYTEDAAYRIRGVVSNYSPGYPVYIALYDSQRSFRDKQFVKALRVNADSLQPDSMRYTFVDIPAGEYVIAAYQDCNGNQELDMGGFGPNEPYAIFRDNCGLFAPSFSKCKFILNADILHADLDMRRGPRCGK